MPEIIPHHTTKSFRDAFLHSGEAGELLLGSGFEQCFILRIEQAFPYLKLPVPPSRENAHTLIFIQSGTIMLRAAGEEFCVCENNGIILPAGIVFSIEKISSDIRGFAFHFSPAWLSKGNTSFSQDAALSAAFTHPLFTCTPAEAAYILPLFTRLENEYRTHELQRSDILRSYLSALLTEIEYLRTQTPMQSLNAARLIVSRFFALLQSRVGQPLRVNYCAQAVHVSPGHLCRAVKSVTGQSPQYWIDEALMQRARVLLRNPLYNVAAVADELGFEDHSYFSRFFRKHAGVSPGTWRKEAEKSIFLHEMYTS
jgi:AraC family transcriptional regulator, transcriptional activator of pobA